MRSISYDAQGGVTWNECECPVCGGQFEKDGGQCSPGCLGWVVSGVNREPGQEIQKCNECDLFGNDDDAMEWACEWIIGAQDLIRKLAHMSHCEDSAPYGHQIAPLADQWRDLVNRARALCLNEPEQWNPEE